MAKKLLFILNPAAGKAQSREPLFDALGVLSDAGYLLRIRTTAGRGHAEDIVRWEGAEYDAVVCCGGDGTLNETVSGLMDLPQERRPLLGYLPRGSTNDFAASLHISANPVIAAQSFARSRPQMLDVGSWNGRAFVYVASFGAFAKSSYSAPQAAKNALGHFAYILEGVRDLNSLRPYRLRLTADSEVLEGEYLFGAVCNSTSIGGLMKLDPERVSMDDGRFELLLIPTPKSIPELQALLPALLNQQYDRGGLIFRHVSHILVEPEEDLPWSLDGEYAPGSRRVEITNRQGAVTMLL